VTLRTGRPSSDSPAIAAFFTRVLEEAGLPAGVVNFVTGSGALWTSGGLNTTGKVW
jgi:acyl-CoA reductase-like NAD-dependent aldehyde dehydrogenase